jgi:predicted ferric reductase
MKYGSVPDPTASKFPIASCAAATAADDDAGSPAYRAPWFASPAWGVVLCVAYPLLMLTPLALLAYLSPNPTRPIAVEVGSDCAIVAFTIISLQFVVAARLRWIEAPFGLDVLLRFHRAMALAAIGLLCLHPVLIASREGLALLTRWQARWPLWAGRVALLLLLVQAGTTFFRTLLRLRYENWRRLHNAVAISLLGLAFVHSLALGGDFESPTARSVWAALLLIASTAWLYARVARPWLQRRSAYRVVSIKPEAARVWTVTLEPAEGRPSHFAPGQFQFLRALGRTVANEEHPFSIASSPSPSGIIALTIKECGDFTATIGRLKPGDLAAVHGPFGRFSHVFHPPADDLVFIAGGVGITPLMSMLRHMRDTRDERPVLLVYANRSASDIVFRGELESIQAGSFPALRTVHVLSQPPHAWDGATGRLDAKSLQHLCGSFSGKTFFICCPPGMTSSLIRGLRREGVGSERIHADYFGL